jgi:hypothetical protein
MITNGGKEIISKYMLNQVNAYATHISIGCGAMPLKTLDVGPELDELLSKEYMDFEMIRIPISSKGFVDNSKTYFIASRSVSSNVATITTLEDNDAVRGETISISNAGDPYNGTHTVTAVFPATKSIQFNVMSPNNSQGAAGTVTVQRTSVSLTAELPSDNRYEITEVAVWSAANNSIASTFDSHLLFNFSSSWQAHSSSIYDPPNLSNIGSEGDITSAEKVFYVSTSNPVFENINRANRKEGARLLNRTILMRGDTSKITGTVGNWIAGSPVTNLSETPTHIHLNNLNFDIGKNSPSDRLNLAFSLIDASAVGENPLPNKVKILIEFFQNEINQTTGYAKLEALINGSDFEGNFYKTINFPISQGIQQSNRIEEVISAVSGNGTQLTFTVSGTHKYEVGMEVTTTGMLSQYNVNNAEIISVQFGSTSSTFTVESGTVTAGQQSVSGLASAYPNIRFITSQDFSPANVRVCRVFVSMLDESENPLDTHYIAFDGMRIENVTSQNPLYKMTGYSIVRNTDGYPIVKSANTNNFVEFRFNLGVS